MNIDFTELNWVTVVASSAVVSAVVNVIANGIFKWIDRRHEAAKENKRTAHVYLRLAVELGEYAAMSSHYLNEIAEAYERLYREHDDSYLSRLRSVPLKFSDDMKWDDLPVEIVDEVRLLQSQMATSNRWISGQYEYMDLHDIYGYEEEYTAYFGVKVCMLERKLRSDIKAGEIHTLIPLKNFQSLIDQRRSDFLSAPGVHSPLPILALQFDHEISNFELSRFERIYRSVRSKLNL